MKVTLLYYENLTYELGSQASIATVSSCDKSYEMINSMFFLIYQFI